MEGTGVQLRGDLRVRARLHLDVPVRAGIPNADIRAMTKAKAGPISAERLKSFIDRIEKLEEERKAISGDIRDVYSEAKGVGYDVKTMRRIVQLRKQDVAERDEEEQLLDVYAHALGMVFNSADTHDIVQKGHHPRTEGELMDYASRIVREVDLCATHLVSMDGSPPKIEAIKGLIGCSAGKASKLRTLVIERLEQISRSIAFHRENEIPQTADGNPPGESEGTTDRPDGPGSALANAIQDAAGRDPGEGEEHGHRNDNDCEGRGAQGLQPERQSGRGGDQGGNGGPRHENGGHSRPEQRAGGPRSGGSDHEHPDGQHVVRPGGDEGILAAAALEVARVAPPAPDRLDIPAFLDRRQKASA
jgi:uncharacterized protein (UPF0335 family)